MKRILLSFIIALIAVVLVACNGDVASPIVISKVYTTTRQANNLIELYNTSEASVDLGEYAFNFYTNGAKEVSQTINLSGTIEANSYFLVGGSNHGVAEVKELIDFSNENGSLPFNGNDVIELTKYGSRIDIFGSIGSDFDFSINSTQIRLGLLTDYQPNKEFNLFNYIGYAPNLYQYLKNDDHEIKTFEQLYEGPRLEERFLEMPYVDPNNSNLGFGGVATSTVQSIADGDTATFQAVNGYPGGSMRYFYINTPEVNGSNVVAEPWGYVASKYNKEYLLKDGNSKLIQLQSIPGNALQEGYGRNLGLVWVNGHLSQFLIVREGLSESDVQIKYEDYDFILTYKNVPYLTFLKFAENEAKNNGWGAKGYPINPNGEKSPDWNYQANNGAGALATTNPTWQPHLPLPW